ncbi:MAG: indolepyruvate ferredoxin oxidoreductase subunit alpha [Anaerolineae bacterium]
MITIHAERCDGCGACLEVCPRGALYLLEGKAVVDEALCRECEVCVAACPTEAIKVTEDVGALVPTRALAVQPESEVIVIESTLSTVPLRDKVLPAAGAALSWAGRELVPRLATYLLDGLDRWASSQPASKSAQGGSSSGGRGGSRGQQRHRHRGGQGGLR